MSEEKKSFSFIEKLKKVKHIEIYIAIIFIVILLLIYMSNFKSNTGISNNTTTTNDMSVTAYIDNLEKNLGEILSSIGGVSDVRVLISLDINQASIENSQITLSEFPPIKGVVVTAKGVNNSMLKMKVLEAIQAVIDVPNGNIQILSGE